MARRSSVPRSGTPALALLNERGVDYQLHEFRHDPAVTDFGYEAARLLRIDPSQVFKTLIFEVDDTHCVALIPASQSVAPKRLATAVGARRARLADTAAAQRLSGSVTGAISPFALRPDLRIVVDASALEHDRVYVSAGKRGWEVCVTTHDLIDVTNAAVAAIGTSLDGS